MATKRFRGKVWAYQVRCSALLPKPIYLTFADEAEGDAYVARLEALLAQGILPAEFRKEPDQKHPRLRGRVIEYRETQPISAADQAVLQILLNTLPPTWELRGLTFDWALGWVTDMKRVQNLAPSTIRARVGALARCLDWLVAKGELPLNPLRQLKRGFSTYTEDDARDVAATGGAVKDSAGRDRRLVEGEEARIRAILAGEKPVGRQRPLALLHAEALQLLFDLALETAMRLSEMYTLTVDQIDLAQRTVFLDKTKNGDKRQVPLSSVAVRLLEAYLPVLAGERLFPWWSGDRSAEEMKRATSLLSRQYARIFDAAGCTGLHFHDLRHEATARLYERTRLTDLQIAKITGHKDIRMLSRYANLRASNLAEALW